MDSFTHYLINFQNLQTNEDGKKYYGWMIENQKRVKITLTKDIPELEGISLYPSIIKQCYVNSTRMMEKNSRISYVEGFKLALGGIPIQHAWNKIGEYYFDITTEQFFPEDIGKDPYYSIVEPTNQEYRQIMAKSKEFGDLLRWWYHYNIRGK